jgi:hypothetical protein
MMRDGKVRAALVAAVLISELVVATAMLAAPRPAPYGWQMYSAVPYNPPAWAVIDGIERSINAEAYLVHGRAEINRLAVLRTRGCELTRADGIRIRLPDGSIDEVTCS